MTISRQICFCICTYIFATPGRGYQILVIDLEGAERRRTAEVHSLVYYLALKKAKVPVEYTCMPRRTRVWTATLELSDYGMSPAGGEVAGNDRDDSEVSISKRQLNYVWCKSGRANANLFS